MDIHPLLLEGPNMESWKTLIPEMLNQLFSPSKVKDIIRLGLGKYIVTFDSCNTIIENLFRELYYDSARIVFSSEYVFDVSIADTTMHRYSIPSPFKTSAPYKMVMNPFILYKGTRSRHFKCEYSEVPLPKRCE